MNIDKNILKRRSVRTYMDKEVSEEQLQTIIEAACLAPSWANTQTWEFIIVRNTETIEKITDYYSPNNPGRRGKPAAVIIGCAKKGIAGHYKDEAKTIHGDWNMFDLGCAVQNISLQAHALGLSTVIIGSMNHEAIHDLLELPEEVDVFVSIPVGYPEKDSYPTPKRRPVSEIAHQEKW